METTRLAKQEFTVRWLAEFELVVKAKDEDEAVEEAINRIKDDDLVDYFDFHTVKE